MERSWNPYIGSHRVVHTGGFVFRPETKPSRCMETGPIPCIRRPVAPGPDPGVLPVCAFRRKSPQPGGFALGRENETLWMYGCAPPDVWNTVENSASRGFRLPWIVHSGGFMLYRGTKPSRCMEMCLIPYIGRPAASRLGASVLPMRGFRRKSPHREACRPAPRCRRSPNVRLSVKKPAYRGFHSRARNENPWLHGRVPPDVRFPGGKAACRGDRFPEIVHPGGFASRRLRLAFAPADSSQTNNR